MTIEEQILLEQEMTEQSINSFKIEFERNKAGNFGNTKTGTELIKRLLKNFSENIQKYIDEYGKGEAVRSTVAAGIISKLGVQTAAYISLKSVLNSFFINKPIQATYKCIGEALEYEFKMEKYSKENKAYYRKIQKDLNSRGANAVRKHTITSLMFRKRLDFHIPKWSVTEKTQTGMILTQILLETTDLIEEHTYFKRGKPFKEITPTETLLKWIEDANAKLELLQPLWLPMVAEPKKWTGMYEGGYLSPYIRRNKLIKNNDPEYIKLINKTQMPIVYEAINHLQETKWQINTEVLEVVKDLWTEGHSVAGIPEREDIPLIPFPYPELDKETERTEEQAKNISEWKQKVYGIHKENVKVRSIRILTQQIINIADKFKNYETIWFPYQMDFRGRLYPIPVLLQPQGGDLAKGLLRFSEGKKCDETGIKWFKIHGANMWGYDKAAYKDRVRFIEERINEVKSYAENPLLNRGWSEADKPFQFLAWCFEFKRYLENPKEFYSKIPVQLDGTCNGLQHYSALLKDPVGGAAVNLINSETPNDIYAKVAEKLELKLKGITNGYDNSTILCTLNNTDSLDSKISALWQSLGINRKLTKRPVMVLPYGGTQLSCRQYITEYLTENYSSEFLYNHFKIGNNSTECVYKISVWLSKYLWEAIKETLQAAIIGMDYLKKVVQVINRYKQFVQWLTPVGLIVRQGYKEQKSREIKTELYGKCLKTTIKTELEDYNSMKQLNGICPNFIHSLDAACLMLYLHKCKESGINSFMTVHDCYGVHAQDTEKSARLLRESFCEIYQRPLLDDFLFDVTVNIPNDIDNPDLPEKPKEGELNTDEVMKSEYFFN